MGYFYKEHRYTCTSYGLKRNISKIFISRDEAKEFMYKVLSKQDIRIEDIWHDNHDVTYVCDNGIHFYIQRVM